MPKKIKVVDVAPEANGLPASTEVSFEEVAREVVVPPPPEPPPLEREPRVAQQDEEMTMNIEDLRSLVDEKLKTYEEENQVAAEQPKPKRRARKQKEVSVNPPEAVPVQEEPPPPPPVEVAPVEVEEVKPKARAKRAPRKQPEPEETVAPQPAEPVGPVIMTRAEVRKKRFQNLFSQEAF